MPDTTAVRYDGTLPPETSRLYYIDWLRVIATLGVFLFHASNVFNDAGFVIKNAERSQTITMIQGFFFPWGMPLFFLVAGAGTWFALQKRSAGEFAHERVSRLLIPFFVGTILLGPIQLYLEWRQKTETGIFDSTLLEFIADRLSSIGPKLFGAVGYHMWFLGYLFSFSLLALPLFVWLRGEAGRSLTSRLARMSELRGGILLFAIPLVAVRLVLQPLFPLEHDWADFFSFGSFFFLGYLLFSDKRFVLAIRRDWPIILCFALATTLAAMVVMLSIESWGIEDSPSTFREFLLWGLIAANGLGWTALVLFVGMWLMDGDSRALRYSLAAMLPFFMVHQVVIVVIAYFVVQWDADILYKMVWVFAGSFAVSLALYELLIKRIPVLRRLFGVKAGQIEKTRVPAGLELHGEKSRY